MLVFHNERKSMWLDEGRREGLGSALTRLLSGCEGVRNGDTPLRQHASDVVAPFPIEQSVCKRDLKWDVREGDDGSLDCKLEYPASLFLPSTIELMADGIAAVVMLLGGCGEEAVGDGIQLSQLYDVALEGRLRPRT